MDEAEKSSGQHTGRRGKPIGWMLLAISSLGILAAPITILRAHPDLTIRAGRHALAGALALAALAVIVFFLAVIPIRRGEKWALVAAALPFAIVSIPMILVDASFVSRDTFWATLAPQIGGFLLGVGALILCAVEMRRRR